MPDTFLTCGCPKAMGNSPALWLFRRARTSLISALSGIALFWILLSGCASHGRQSDVKDLTKYKSICFKQAAPFDQVYMQSVGAVFTRHGFDTAPKEIEPDTLICIMGTKENDMFDMSFVITLWSGKKKVLNVEARDEHYGDHASTREANDQLVRDALDKLDSELSKAMKPEGAKDKG